MTFKQYIENKFPKGFEEFDGNLDESDLEQAYKAGRVDVLHAFADELEEKFLGMGNNPHIAIGWQLVALLRKAK